MNREPFNLTSAFFQLHFNVASCMQGTDCFALVNPAQATENLLWCADSSLLSEICER